MSRYLLIAAIVLGSPFVHCSPLTYDFEVVVREDGIRFAGMFTVVEGAWDDTFISTPEITDIMVTVSDGLCCAFDFVPSFPGGMPPTGGQYVPRLRFPSFTLTSREALDRGSFFIRPEFDEFNLTLREFLLDGSELRTSVHVNPNRQGGTSAGVEYWNPGGMTLDREFFDTLYDSNPFSGSPPFSFALALRPAAVPIPTTLGLVSLGLVVLRLSHRQRCLLQRANAVGV